MTRPGTEPSSGTGFPRAFVIVTFAVSALVGIAVAYLGMRGTLGAPIP